MIAKEKFIQIMQQYNSATFLSHLDEMYDQICHAELHEGASPQEFLADLTPAELAALRYLLSLISYSEGTLVISRLVESSNLSRAVITNLIAKIEKYKVMEIKSKGVKGTYFKVLVDFKNI